MDHVLLPMVLVALVAAFDACNLSHRLADSLPYMVAAIAVVLAGGSFLLAAYIFYIRDDGVHTEGQHPCAHSHRGVPTAHMESYDTED